MPHERLNLTAVETIALDERKALLSGRLDILPELARRKVEAVETLASAGATAEHLRRAVACLQSNGALIQEALRGVQDGQARLVNINKAMNGLRHYDKSGVMAVEGESLTNIVRNA